MYESTEGFEAKGWTQTGSVPGFGWKNMSVISAGLQVKGIDRLPLRAGYNYSTNPIESEPAFFSAPATAIIKNAFQVGAGFEINERFTINDVYHYVTSSGATSGLLLNPMAVTGSNPYGAMPGTSYSMTTSMIMSGINYTFTK